jgi:hypothetical protein
LSLLRASSTLTVFMRWLLPYRGIVHEDGGGQTMSWRAASSFMTGAVFVVDGG